MNWIFIHKKQNERKKKDEKTISEFIIIPFSTLTPFYYSFILILGSHPPFQLLLDSASIFFFSLHLFFFTSSLLFVTSILWFVLSGFNWVKICVVWAMDVKAAPRLQLSAVVQPESIGRRPPSTCRLGVSREPQSLRVFVSSTMMRRRTTALEVSCSYGNISGSHSNQWSHHVLYIYIYIIFPLLVLLNFVLAAFHSLLLLKSLFGSFLLLFNFAERIVSSELSVFQTKWRIGNCGKKV